ncbi:MAG TPA: hypothetical protein DDW93_02685, partial [Firmicutes bacterium]|nr:hypothetical protein [Bacillota bacterium]
SSTLTTTLARTKNKIKVNFDRQAPKHFLDWLNSILGNYAFPPNSKIASFILIMLNQLWAELSLHLR